MGDLKKEDNVKKAAAAAAADDDDEKLKDVVAVAVAGSDSVKEVTAAGDDKSVIKIILGACLLYYFYTIRWRLLAAVKVMAMDFLFEIFKVIAILMGTLLIIVLINFIGLKTYHPVLPKEKDDEHVKAPDPDAGEQKPIPDHDHKPIKAASDASNQKPITDHDHDHKPIKATAAAAAAAAAGGAQKRQPSTPYGINMRVFCNLTMLIFFYMNYQRLFAIGKELFIALVMATIIAIVVFAVLMIIHISVAEDDMKTEDHHVQLTVPVPDDNNEIHSDQVKKIIGDDDEQKHDHDQDHKAEDHHEIQQVIGGGGVEKKHDYHINQDDKAGGAAASASMGPRDEEPQNQWKKLRHEKPQRQRKKNHYKTQAFLESVLQGTNTIMDILSGQALFSLFNR